MNYYIKVEGFRFTDAVFVITFAILMAAILLLFWKINMIENILDRAPPSKPPTVFHVQGGHQYFSFLGKDYWDMSNIPENENRKKNGKK